MAEKTELTKRPCIEEFLAAGYKEEQYDTYFGDSYGPGWSNPSRKKPEEGPEPREDGLPHHLVVHSQVRRVGTRTVRATSPTRHRFKQYLFGDPSRRLVRNGRVTVPTDLVYSNLEELALKEKQGILSVHLADGSRVNLESLLSGMPQVAALPLPSPQAHPPLDSIANDSPSGIPMQTYIDGTFAGDPAAQRALDSMVGEKKDEQGADNDEQEPVTEVPPPPPPMSETPPPPPEKTEELEQDTEMVDPASEVSAEDAATEASVETTTLTPPSGKHKKKGGR